MADHRNRQRHSVLHAAQQYPCGFRRKRRPAGRDQQHADADGGFRDELSARHADGQQGDCHHARSGRKPCGRQNGRTDGSEHRCGWERDAGHRFDRLHRHAGEAPGHRRWRRHHLQESDRRQGAGYGRLHRGERRRHRHRAGYRGSGCAVLREREERLDQADGSHGDQRGRRR